MKINLILREGADVEIKTPAEEKYLKDTAESLKIAMLATRELVRDGKITAGEAVERVAPGINMLMFHYFNGAPWEPNKEV